MTQYVFDNAMVAHVWAAQSQDSGRSHNGNFYFEGRTLYSYGSHYVCGYAAPGGLYLLNADDSTMTTKGKHMNAARRAVDYGRGKFANCHTIPGLTETARELGRAATMPSAEAVQYMARHLESYGGADWPGAEAATAIYRAMGASTAEATRRGRAGADRVARAEAKAKAKADRTELDSLARDAKRIARADPRETAEDVRDLLAEAVGESAYWADRKESEAAELGREAHRAAKAARAKGWHRIAAACVAHHRAARAEIRQFEAHRARYAERAALAADIAKIRGAAAQVAQFWALNPTAKAGADVADHGATVRACENGAKGFGELAAALGRVADSRYGSHGLTGPAMHGLRRWAAEATETAETLRIRAGELRTAWQADARAAWLADGTRPPYQVGRLCDVRGAALLRAEGVERDDSGAVVGGMLRTSWGATVPLTHAIRAFRFLRHCRDTATEWRANGRTLRVGHFTVDHVDSAGNFVAGCHRISWAECERVAGVLGLDHLTGADTTTQHDAARVAS